MSALGTQAILQLILWGISLVELILALYILVLNIRHSANQYVGFLFILFAANSFGIGLLTGATDVTQANAAAAILASTTPVFGLGLFITAVVLVKPAWIYGRWKWVWWVARIFSILPTLVTLVDLSFGTQIWFTGLDPQIYLGGYQSLATYTNPDLMPIRMIYLIGLPLFAIIPLSYLAFFDKALTALEKRLALLLLAGQIGASIIQIVTSRILLEPIPSILTDTIFFVIYAYASFSQMVSERRLQRGRLQVRLTTVVFVIAIPLLFFTPTYLFSQTSTQIRQDAVGRLEQTSQSIAINTETWLDLNIKALEQLTVSPGIVSMNPTIQKPILEAMDQTYPSMYLVSTTDQSGINVARSDTANLTDYSDRSWYQDVIQGADVAFQTLIGRTSGEPAIVVSKPIYKPSGEIIGVGMFASDLNAISINVANVQIGNTGKVFIVDPKNLVVAHTDETYANQLVDFSLHPAVVAMRNLDQESMRYKDQYGTTWIAYFQEIENDWGVVVEQDEAELLATLRSLQAITWVGILIGGVLLGVLTSLAIRQAIRPINNLTDTATAIAEGDLSRIAAVESEDEIGFLARTFNRMTEQLLDLIGGLEQRVADRTKDLENRSNQLEAATQVGQAASSILDVNELIETTVELIRERFNLYYVGLFLVDEFQEYAILRAGTGEAGQAMLARQHMIPIGEGMIGWSIANESPRVAMEVGEDAIRKPTAELPETRSEAAIPLRSRGQVIGAITVQSRETGTFDTAMIAVLQTMADLIGVAIDNARLFTESETALQATRQAYSELSHEDWLEILQSRPELSFRSDRSGVIPAQGFWTPPMRKAWAEAKTVQSNLAQDNQESAIAIPIKVRDNVIGVLQTHKVTQSGTWTEVETTMLETIVEQIGLALDSARLYEETQIQANNERLIGEVTAHMRETLDIETVLQTAARELRAVLDLAEVEVRMGNAPNQIEEN